MNRLDTTLRRHAAVANFALVVMMTASVFAISLVAGCGRDQSDRRTAGPANGDGPAPSREVGLHDAGELGPPHLLAFDCDQDDAYLAVFDPTSATVTLHTPQDVRLLTQQTSASGARFGDDRYQLWTKGHDEILLEIDGRRREGCEPSGRQRLLAAAYQAGFLLRATGNEPFWSLLAGPQSIRLERLGMPAASFDGVAGAELANGATIERAYGPHVLRITVVEQPCHDSMSGEPSGATVVIELDGVTLQGCGVRLR